MEPISNRPSHPRLLASMQVATLMLAIGCNRTPPPPAELRAGDFQTSMVRNTEDHKDAVKITKRTPEIELRPDPVNLSRNDSTRLRMVKAKPILIPEHDPKTLQTPKVFLSNQHARTCLKVEGDSIGDLTFTNDKGELVVLKDFLSEHLSVVVFANPMQAMSRDQIARVDQEVTDRFARSGLRTIVIVVGAKSSSAGNELKNSVELFDENGEAFGKIATIHLPRTYVVDQRGQILWFDLEYSRHMRNELQNAILFYLKKRITTAARELDEMINR